MTWPPAGVDWYYADAYTAIACGDCREVVPGLSDISYILTDPPYGLSFMGKDWDHGLPGESFWRLFAAACKPGAMLMSFGGTRTWHRLTCAIEDAGWEIRDCCMFLYGSGFPKSHNISKAIDKAAGAKREKLQPGNPPAYQRGIGNTRPWMDEADHKIDGPVPITEAAKQWNGWGTALKPAWEPVILAMNPLDGTFAQNATAHGVAGLNIDAGRIGTAGRPNIEQEPKSTGNNAYAGRIDGSLPGGPKAAGITTQGRWPANLLLDEAAAAMLDAQSGASASGITLSPDGRQNSNHSMFIDGQHGPDNSYTDSGGASRFFYTAKANAEREPYNDHPTLKPVCLMQYLLKLLSAPTGGVVLDPFMGSGTTLLAAKRLQRRCIGIEREEAYCAIAARRLTEDAPLFNEPSAPPAEPPELFTMDGSVT